MKRILNEFRMVFPMHCPSQNTLMPHKERAFLRMRHVTLHESRAEPSANCCLVGLSMSFARIHLCRIPSLQNLPFLLISTCYILKFRIDQNEASVQSLPSNLNVRGRKTTAVTRLAKINPT